MARHDGRRRFGAQATLRCKACHDFFTHARKNLVILREHRTNTDLLQELFADLDQQYFSGCIGAAGYRVSLQTPGARMYFIGADGRPDLKQYVGEPAGGLCYTDVRQIFIRPRFVYGKLVIRVVLLHEMVHAAVAIDHPLADDEDPHGDRFKTEMARLKKAGAVK